MSNFDNEEEDEGSQGAGAFQSPQDSQSGSGNANANPIPPGDGIVNPNSAEGSSGGLQGQNIPVEPPA